MSTPELGGIQRELAHPARGAVRQYRSLAVGDGHVWDLVRYELIISLCGAFRGRPGILLRRLFYPLLFRAVGREATFGRNVALYRPGKIKLGDRVSIGDHAALVVKSEAAEIVLGDSVSIGSEAALSCRGGRLIIGNHTAVGPRSRVGSSQGLRIGEHAVLESETYVSGASHSIARLDLPIIMQPLTCKGPTTIGNHARIGAGATILEGVTIGDHAEVASGALVNQDVAPERCVSGIPAAEEE